MNLRIAPILATTVLCGVLASSRYFAGIAAEAHALAAATDAPLTGSGNGGTAGVLADQIGPINRPREIGLQIAVRF